MVSIEEISYWLILRLLQKKEQRCRRPYESPLNQRVTVEMDFLNCEGQLKGFDVCIDKGTFDAISLNPDNTEDGKKKYVQSLKDALKDGGFFSITSCNWTKEQLLERFGEGFEFVQELPTPSFKFGGKTGNSVAALIFKKIH